MVSKVQDLGADLGDMEDVAGSDAVVKTASAPKAKKPAKKAKKPAKAPTTTAKSLGLTKIILEENDDIPPTGLFLGVNGRGYLVATGVEVDVNASVLDVLNNAIMDAPQLNAKQQVVGYRPRMRYPYRVVT